MFDNVKNWFKKTFFKAPPIASKSTVYNIPSSSIKDEPEPDRVRPTKAYADQRQKNPRNRKHKPSKAMKNLYNL